MVGEDVAAEMVFDDGFTANKKLYDALLSEHEIVRVDEDVLIARGYIRSGTGFVPPETV